MYYSNYVTFFSNFLLKLPISKVYNLIDNVHFYVKIKEPIVTILIFFNYNKSAIFMIFSMLFFLTVTLFFNSFLQVFVNI